MTKLKQCKLSNGMDILYASKANLAILQREFDDDLYNKNGIQLSDGDCIFDVGGNIGFFVMYLNQDLKDATVFSFEPIPETYELLQRNTDAHNQLQLKMFNCGLSDEPGTATFTHYPKSNVCSTMCPQDSPEYFRNSRKYVLDEIRKRGAIWKTLVDFTPAFMWYPLTEVIRRHYKQVVRVECEIRTISDVIEENNVEQIDYLKIDTEGAELNILKGIRDEHWPRVRQVVVEVHHGDEGLDQVVSLLKKHGMQIVTEQPCDTLSHLRMVYATRGDEQTKAPKKAVCNVDLELPKVPQQSRI